LPTVRFCARLSRRRLDAAHAMASLAATPTLAPAHTARRRRSARAGLAPRTRPCRRAVVRCSLDANVSDMGVNGEEWDPAAAGPLLSEPPVLFIGRSV
jgi:hypothetical protein